MEFIQAACCTKRPERKITAIVLHYTSAMALESTISWFLRKESQVSSHYLIGREGRVVQMVRDKDIAWHAGVSELDGQTNVNKFSIGIELVGTADSHFTDIQIAALYDLLEKLVMKYIIPSTRVVGHKDVARPKGRKIDPDGYNSQFNWARTKEVVANIRGERNV